MTPIDLAPTRSSESVPPVDHFADHERQLRWFRAVLGLAIGSLLMPLGTILDLSLYPDQSGPLIALRLLTTGVLVGGLIVLVKRKPRTWSLAKWIEPFSLGLVLFPALAICGMLHLCDGVDSPYYYGLILLMIVVHLLGFGWRESLVYCLTTLGAYLLAVLLHPDFSLVSQTQALVQGLFFLTTSGLVCTVVCLVNHDNRLKSFQLQRQAERQAQARTDFLADVSHELRTPLTLISAPLEDLLQSRSGLDKAVGQTLTTMRRNVARLKYLVDDVLEVVRDPNAAPTIENEEVDLRELLDDLVNGTRDAACADNVTIELSGTTSLVSVRGDGNRLQRVVLNLLNNAMKFSPPSSIINIHLDVRDDSAWIEVTDQGPGIPAKQLQHVFERHYQAGNVDPVSTAKGLGLGLAIAKQIIEDHQGKIDVVNQPGAGAKFRVCLPLAEPVLPLTAEPSANLSTQPTVKADGTALSQAVVHESVPLRSRDVTDDLLTKSSDAANVGTVLIIDDEPELRAYLAGVLKVYYRVHVAANATDGIQLARQVQPDCILLDFMLPDSHHLSTLASLCDEPALIDTKILMLTASGDESIKLEALKRGSDDFLSKPFGTAELVARVDGLVRSARLQSSLREQKALLEQSMIDLKVSEAKLLQSEKMRAIAQLAGGLLHEINNPINYTLMAIKVLRRQSAGQHELDETITDIDDGVNRISDVLADLRQFATPDAQANSQDFAIADVIGTAIRFASGGSEDIEIVIDKSDGYQTHCYGSKSQATQVMVNLLTNSMRAIGARKADVSESCDEDYRGVIRVFCRQQSDRLFVAVADNGCGMNPEQQQRIFEPFYTSGHEGGLGLGLHVCQAIIDDHGGKLTFQSKVGEGTQATFDLPVAKTTEPIVASSSHANTTYPSHDLIDCKRSNEI